MWSRHLSDSVPRIVYLVRLGSVSNLDGFLISYWFWLIFVGISEPSARIYFFTYPAPFTIDEKIDLFVRGVVHHDS